MKLAGNFILPVFLSLTLAMIYSASGQEIVTHSMPVSIANQQQAEHLRWQTPIRSRQYLNGSWELLRTREANVAVPLRIPCTIRHLPEFVIRKSFDLEVTGRGNYVLHLGVLNGHISLYINDVLLYEGSNNFLPVSLGLESSRLQKKGNLIELVFQELSVIEENTPGFLPVSQPRWNIGLLTGVYLEARPDLYIDNIFVSDRRKPAGTVKLNKAVDSTQFALNISYRNKTDVIFSRRMMLSSGDIGPELPEPGKTSLPEWSTEQPQPLWIEATLDSAGKIIDVYRQPFARRNVAIKDGFLQINDQAIRLNGINYVYQNREGSTLFDAALVKKDLEDIKARGFNALRVIQNPLPEAFYQLCDEIGLLCLQDLPIVLPSAISGQFRNSLESWAIQQRYLEDLSRRYNAIVGIGVAQYMNGSSSRQMKMLRAVLQRFGPSEITRYASVLMPAREAATLLDFQIVEFIDRKRVGEHFEAFTDSLKPFLMMPSAFFAAADYHADTSTAFQERHQQKRIYTHLTKQQLPADLKGHFIYTYSDYYLRLPSLQNGSLSDPFLQQSGLVNLKREVREPVGEETTAVARPLSLRVSENTSQNYLYIIVGFVNIFLFLVSYRRYRIFRINLKYSLKKPHGFFVNLSERITIPYKQSLFLMLVLAVNGGLVWSAFAFYFRKHLLTDYIFSFFFFTPAAKELIVSLFWNQTLSVVVFASLIIVLFYVLAAIIKIFAMFTRSRVSFGQALAASIWAAAPFIGLLLLGVIIYSMLQGMDSYWILVGFLLYFHAWYYLRWINGARVLTDKLYLRTALLYTVIAALIFTGILYFYQVYFNIREHAQWVYELYGFLQQ